MANINAPLGSKGASNNQNTHINYSTHDPLNDITRRLKGVIKRQNGGMMAFCPSHDDRKGRSLAVSLGRQGQVLMHCFAGCSIHEITAAIDLNPADLFPRTESEYEPQSSSYFNEWQILTALQHDATIVLLAARWILTGKPLPESDLEYLSEAVIRIGDAVNYSVRCK